MEQALHCIKWPIRTIGKWIDTIIKKMINVKIFNRNLSSCFICNNLIAFVMLPRVENYLFKQKIHQNHQRLINTEVKVDGRRQISRRKSRNVKRD